MGQLFQELKEIKTTKPTRWEQVITTLPAEEVADLEEALDDPTISNTAIVQVLKRRGIIVDRQTVSKWRKGLR